LNLPAIRDLSLIREGGNVTQPSESKRYKKTEIAYSTGIYRWSALEDRSLFLTKKKQRSAGAYPWVVACTIRSPI